MTYSIRARSIYRVGAPALLTLGLAAGPAFAQSVVVETPGPTVEKSTTKTTVKENSDGDTVVKEKTKTTNSDGDTTVRTEKRTVDEPSTTTTTTTVR